jgi:hypothetical protein
VKKTTELSRSRAFLARSYKNVSWCPVLVDRKRGAIAHLVGRWWPSIEVMCEELVSGCVGSSLATARAGHDVAQSHREAPTDNGQIEREYGVEVRRGCLDVLENQQISTAYSHCRGA